MRTDKITEHFSPLGEIKLSAEDKAEILHNLRHEMNRATVKVVADTNRLTSRRRHRPLRTVAAIAASIAIVAGGAATVDRLLQGPASPTDIQQVYAYTKVAPPHFNSLQMTGLTTGWGYGYDDAGRFHLIRTVSGIGWSKVALPIEPPIYDISINQIGMPGYVQAYFADDSHGWLAWIEGDRLTFLQTMDGGAHWHASHATMPMYAETVANVDFVSDNHGWLLAVSQPGMGGEHKILFGTSDGGETWKKLTDDGTGLPHAGTTTGLTFDAKGLNGWLSTGSPVSTGNILYRTEDGGHTWKSMTVPLPASLQGSNPTMVSTPVFEGMRGTVSAIFTSQNVNVPVVYHTADGGDHWTPVTVTGQGYGMPDFVSQSVGFVIQRGGSAGIAALMRTADGGHHWNPLYRIPADLLKVYPNVTQLSFVTRDVGWMLLQSGDYKHSTLMRTTDGGRTWMVP